MTVPTFFIGKYEVTQAQWQIITRLPRVNLNLVTDPSEFKGNHRPVEQVSWEEAVEFCARLSRATGREYRLPTEAEWEYACRAGTTTQFAFGDTITAEVVNYNGSFPFRRAPIGTYRGGTTDVGSLGVANRFGLYDMHGNVFEWCLDSWHDSYDGAPTDGSAWGRDGDGRRVIRGGKWSEISYGSISANRSWNLPGNRDSGLGFRVVTAVRN